ncbi:MAG: amidohydrolase family protein [Syntrophobacteraceae bacterium]|nr:amidohydrolase family protein [Syntrophobacteraceae bacterium]
MEAAPLNTILHVWAGWLIDGTGGPARRDVLIHVEGGKIVSLRRMRLEDKLALEDRLVDCSESTILPGLIDSHVHLTMSGTGDESIRQKQLSYTADQAMPVIRSHLAQSLSRGVVAVRDGGDAASHTLSYATDPALHSIPFRVRAAGKAWRSRGRYGRLIGGPPAEGMSLAQSIASDPSPLDHVKIVNSGVNSLKEFGRETRPQFSAAELDAAVQAARRKGLKTMVHANGSVPVRDAVDAGATSIEHGFFMGNSNLERMADLQVFWVPTAITMKAYARELPKGGLEAEIAWRTLEHQVEQIAYARRLGAPVLVGTDSGSLGVHHGLAVAGEMEILVDAGYTVEEAVCCATSDPSRLLGLRGEMGQIKKGMEGTFVVVAGPPKTLLRRMGQPEKVFVQGRLVASGGLPILSG